MLCCTFSYFELFHVSLTQVAEGISHNSTYIKKILKKVIVCAESTCEDILDGLYEQCSYHMTLHTVIHHIVFLFSSSLLVTYILSNIHFYALLWASL